MIDKNILHYKIIKKLGEGGMGIVYLAEDTKLDRKVAIKFLPNHIADNSDERKRFEIEAKAAAALNHPNIATVYNIEDVDDEMFIVMEYIEGQELKDKLKSVALEVDEAINITLQIAEGLESAHEKNIVHRDIKSSNIMITDKGQVKIMDFGLAKVRGGAELTKEQSTIGTAAYMSPEQARGEKVDQRSDLWALGVVLYEMLCGRHPFQGDYEQAMLYSIINEHPEPLARFKAGIPEKLQSIIDKALSKTAETRFQSASDFIVDLKRLQQRINPPDLISHDKQRRSRSLFIVAAVTLLLILSVHAIFFMNGGDQVDRREDFVFTQNRNHWENSIAVLPFKNISSDAEQEYFCEGMTEQIISSLGQLQNLKVIARTSVMKFKNTQKTIPEIANELEVAHVLEGSIRKAGNRIRVTAQLIQADGGHQLWANDYDQDLNDIFAVQDNVSEAIARALLDELTATESEYLKTKWTDNVLAYEYYLKGNYFHYNKYFMNKLMQDFKISENMFQKAIELDSGYALAYAGLADLYNSYFHEIDDADERKIYLDLQQTLIDKAHALDPRSGEVKTIEGIVYAAKGEVERSFESYKQAYKINPNSPNLNFAIGVFLGSHELMHHAVKFFNHAIETDPLSPSNYWIRAIYMRELGNVEVSIADYQEALELEPDNVHSLNGISKCFMIQKNIKQAEHHLAKSEKINPASRDTKRTRALLYAARGNTEKAFEILAEINSDDRYDKIVVYCLAGLKSEALKLIDNRPWARYLVMLHHPYFTILHDTVEYNLALRKARKEYEKNLDKYGSYLPGSIN